MYRPSESRTLAGKDALLTRCLTTLSETALARGDEKLHSEAAEEGGPRPLGAPRERAERVLVRTRCSFPAVLGLVDVRHAQIREREVRIRVDGPPVLLERQGDAGLALAEYRRTVYTDPDC